MAGLHQVVVLILAQGAVQAEVLEVALEEEVADFTSKDKMV